MKKRKQKIDKGIENQWEELEQVKMEEYDVKLTKKLEQQYKVKMDNAKVIKDQLYDFKVKHIKKMKEEQLEGELIKRRAKEDQENER